MSDTERLTVRLETFCQAMARGMSLTRAGIEAGWSEATAHAAGWRAAKRPDVIARTAQLRQELETDRAAALAAVEMPTRVQVLRDLLEVAQVAKGSRQLQSQLRALELVGKELGMFVQRTEIKIENPLASLSPAALLQLSRILDGEAEEVEEPLLLEGDEVEEEASE